jgi:isopentenyl-diphosphate delta-isomerase type 1
LEELLDIVAENNQVIGQEKRSIVHQSGLWHRGVHIFLFTPEQKLVIQQRSRHRRQSPGALDCSVSEHLKAGESYLAGAIRGLEEELGIKQAPLRRLVQFKMDYGPGDNMISTLYEGTVDREAIQTDANEVERIIYHSISETEELLAQGEVLYSRWFEQLLLWYVGKSSDIQVIDNPQDA